MSLEKSEVEYVADRPNETPHEIWSEREQLESREKRINK